jgi:hypothetical protein
MPSPPAYHLVNPKPHPQRYSILLYRNVPRPDIPFRSDDHLRDITIRSTIGGDSYDGIDRRRWRGCYAFVSFLTVSCGGADDSLVGALSDYVSVTMWLRRWADDSSGCGYFPRLLLS